MPMQAVQRRSFSPAGRRFGRRPPASAGLLVNLMPTPPCPSVFNTWARVVTPENSMGWSGTLIKQVQALCCSTLKDTASLVDGTATTRRWAGLARFQVGRSDACPEVHRVLIVAHLTAASDRRRKHHRPSAETRP